MTKINESHVLIENQGSIFMVTPLSSAARQWVDENVPTENWQWLGSSFAVEHRFIDNLVVGMQEAGLSVHTHP